MSMALTPIYALIGKPLHATQNKLVAVLHRDLHFQMPGRELYFYEFWKPGQK